jgi:hypothetical protein
MLISELDPENGTRGIVGDRPFRLLDGADHDEADETED